MSIDPKSMASILLREHDSASQAAAYAERKARTLGAMHHGAACEYAEAARILRELTPADAGHPDNVIL